MKYPTKNQVKALNDYIENGGEFSIYGMDGVYELLENELRKIYNVNHCLLTNSGTSSLSSAYFGLGLVKGDEVIVPIYTYMAAVTPLLRLGCVPVFADVLKTNGNIDVDSLEKLVTPKTKAVAITHMWGNPCKMDEIVGFCNRYNLKLVEDCSHAHLTRFDGKLLGTFGDVACFSVSGMKTLSGGMGGFVITNNEEIFIRATLLGHCKKRAKEAIKKSSPESKIKYGSLISGFGENYRIHPYSAVMTYELLKNELVGIMDERYAVYHYFSERLGEIPKIEAPEVCWGGLYGFEPKLLKGNLCDFIAEAEKSVKIQLPYILPLCEDRIFATGCLFPLEYPGVKEYMRGRFSIPDIATGALEEDKKTVDRYIDAFKEILK